VIAILASAAIDPGVHITRKLFGVAINVDTVWASAIAGALILLLGFAIRAKATAGVPGKLQLAFETIVTGVSKQVDSTMGEAGRPIVPLAISLFLYILIANLLEMIPTGHSPQYLPAPSGDINFTLALALFVIVLVHVTWIRKQGLKRYVGHYFKPFAVLFPINAIEEFVKPITLALRLFGNIFSGVIMVSLIALFPPAILWAPNVLWKLFDGFIGLIQAFIFGLLTVIYFSSVRPAEEGAH
jgi:F-type H+-transporting ATPase subunit a